ncbi:TPA: hypothetical protein ACH3X3_004463 [Trebouxia sp. C0006]
MLSRTVVNSRSMPWAPLWRCSVSVSGPGTWWSLPDTAAVSNPAALERLVKDRVDSVGPNRGSSQVSQSITAVTRIGRPGAGNRAVLVEYSSNQAKHKTYALSRQLRQQGISLTDELTPKQQQAQKALDPDRIALRSKGFRTWLRHGTLWYLDQGVPSECKQGEAVRLPQAQGSPPGPNIPAARAPPRGPSGRPRQTPGRSGGNIPASTPRANRVVAPVPASCQAPPRPASPNASPPGPSYAFVARSDPATAMDTGPAASAGPGAGPTSAAAAAPSCTPTATPTATLQLPLQLPLQSAQLLHQLGPLLPPTPNRGLPASNNSNCLSLC